MSDIKIRREPRPVLLTKAEALEFAATQLTRISADVELGKMLLGVLTKQPLPTPLDPDAEIAIGELRRAMLEPDLQLKALDGAAKAIRELALEERLHAAKQAQPA